MNAVTAGKREEFGRRSARVSERQGTPALPEIEVRSACGGHGVFTHTAIAAGARVLEFIGDEVGRAEVARAAAANGHDGYLQVSRDVFLGQSGGADDYVNHSCAPNCYVEFAAGRVWLVALVDIPAGAELYFDYGLTQIDFPFRFNCLCGATSCRGPIGNYDEVPASLMDEYRAKGMVPPHVEAELDARSAPVALNSRARS